MLSRCTSRLAAGKCWERASFSTAARASRPTSLASRRRVLALALAIRPTQCRRYASTREEPKGAGGEGVVSSPPNLSIAVLTKQIRILTMLSCKETLPTTLMKCTCSGSAIHQASTSHGKSTSATWRTATCPLRKPSNRLLPSFHSLMAVCNLTYLGSEWRSVLVPTL